MPLYILKLQPHFGIVCIYEHYIVYRDIDDLSVLLDRSLIGNYVGFLYIVILILYKCIQRTMDSIILARFYFHRNCGKAAIIINQIVNLTLVAIVILYHIICNHDVAKPMQHKHHFIIVYSGYFIYQVSIDSLAV